LRLTPVEAMQAKDMVVPSAKDGLHCGNIAQRQGLFAGEQVVPSAKDGLHCGESAAATVTPVISSSRPPRTGSIAARRSPTRSRCI